MTGTPAARTGSYNPPVMRSPSPVWRATLAAALACGLLATATARGAELRELEDLLPALDRFTADLRGAVGVAVVSLPRYSGAGEQKLRVLPLVSASYKDTVYFHIKRAGVWLYKTGDGRLRLGLAVEPRGGRHAGDGPLLAGTEDRGTSWEAGLAGEWRLEPLGRLELALFSDVSGNSEGGAASLRFTTLLHRQAPLKVLGSLGVEYLSGDVVDFYYGVRPGEVTAARPLYRPGGTVQLKAALLGTYHLVDHWRLYGGVTLVRLGDAAADSPVVARRHQKTAYLGLGWGL